MPFRSHEKETQDNLHFFAHTNSCYPFCCSFLRSSCKAINSNFCEQFINVREQAGRAIVLQIFFIIPSVQQNSLISTAWDDAPHHVPTEPESLPKLVPFGFNELDADTVAAESFPIPHLKLLSILFWWLAQEELFAWRHGFEERLHGGEQIRVDFCLVRDLTSILAFQCRHFWMV